MALIPPPFLDTVVPIGVSDAEAQGGIKWIGTGLSRDMTEGPGPRF